MRRRRRPGILCLRSAEPGFCGARFARVSNDGDIFPRTALPSRAAFRVRALPNLRPSDIRGRRECRAPMHPQPRVQNEKSTRVSHHRFTGQHRHSLRNGFNGLLRALPGDRAFLSPSPAQCEASSRVDISVEMSGPHGFAVRCAHRTPCDKPASTAPCPAFVAIASRPSWWDRMGRGHKMICPTAQGEILVRYLGRLRRLHRDEIKGSHCK